MEEDRIVLVLRGRLEAARGSVAVRVEAWEEEDGAGVGSAVGLCTVAVDGFGAPVTAANLEDEVA